MFGTQALAAFAGRDLADLWHPASFMLDVISNTERTWQFKTTAGLGSGPEQRRWEEHKRYTTHWPLRQTIGRACEVCCDRHHGSMQGVRMQGHARRRLKDICRRCSLDQDLTEEVPIMGRLMSLLPAQANPTSFLTVGRCLWQGLLGCSLALAATVVACA